MKTVNIFWIFVFFLINFNNFLKLFIPRTYFTLIYVLILFLFWARHSTKIISSFKIKISKTDFLILLYVIWLTLCFVLQLIFGNTTNASFISFGQTMIPILGYALAKNISYSDAEKYEKYFVVFSLVSIGLGYLSSNISFLSDMLKRVEYVRVNEGLETRAFSMAGGSLSTGYICGLAIGFLLVCNIKKKIKLCLCVVLFLYSLMTYSRGGVFFILIILSVYYFWSYLVENKGKIKLHNFFKVILVLLGIIFLVVLNWETISSSNFYHRIVKQGFSSLEGSNILRKNLQSAGVELFLENLLLGKGFGFVGYEAVVYKVLDSFSPENYFLLLGIESGIIGVVLFVLIIIYSVLKRDRLHDDINKKYIAIVVGIVAWGLMYIVIESDLNAMLFWYCIGRINYVDVNNVKSSVKNSLR